MQVVYKHQNRQVNPAMKQDWREKAVIKSGLRKLYKMTKQISGIIWLWTQASHVQLQSSQGIMFQKSLRWAVWVPPAKNFILLHPLSVAKLQKNVLATLTLYRLLILLYIEKSLLARVCNSENNSEIFSSNIILDIKGQKGNNNLHMKTFQRALDSQVCFGKLILNSYLG